MIINLLLALITVLLTILSWLKDIRSQDKEKKLYGMLSIALILLAAVLTIIKDQDAASQINSLNQVIDDRDVQITNLKQIIGIEDPEHKIQKSLNDSLLGRWKIIELQLFKNEISYDVPIKDIPKIPGEAIFRDLQRKRFWNSFKSAGIKFKKDYSILMQGDGTGTNGEMLSIPRIKEGVDSGDYYDVRNDTLLLGGRVIEHAFKSYAIRDGVLFFDGEPIEYRFSASGDELFLKQNKFGVILSLKKDVVW